MNSIFNKISNETMIGRINKLSPESKALWGKMTVAQMFEHNSLAIDIAFGKETIKTNFFMRLLGRMLRKKVLYGGELKKNSPTAKEFIMTADFDFETSKKKLTNRFRSFASEGKAAIKILDHPFWGKMTYEEWDILMWKHLDHHLSQFGV